jgi:hypothetical protein
VGHVDGRPLNGFAGVLALILVEIVAGASVLAWGSPLWNEAKRLFFSIWAPIVLVLFAWPAWIAAHAGATPGDDAGATVVRLTLASAAALTITTILLLARQQAAGRVAGIVSAAIAVVTLGAMAGTGRQSWPVSTFQLLAGAAFLGATFSALFLGHWYLTDRKLSRRPINRFTTILIGATVLEGIAIATGGFSGSASSESFNPLLTAGGLAPWIAVGSAVTTLVIAIFARLTLQGERASAVQAATGFFYLALITAFVAEVAVKTRFLPA